MNPERSVSHPDEEGVGTGSSPYCHGLGPVDMLSPAAQRDAAFNLNPAIAGKLLKTRLVA